MKKTFTRSLVEDNIILTLKDKSWYKQLELEVYVDLETMKLPTSVKGEADIVIKEWHYYWDEDTDMFKTIHVKWENGVVDNEDQYVKMLLKEYFTSQ
jgi:hypothetical protein